MSAVLSFLGGVILFLLQFILILLAVLLGLGLLLLLCPFCADLSWEDEILRVRVGALGITLPVFQFPEPEPPAMEGGEPPEPGFWARQWKKFRAWLGERRRRRAAKKPPRKPEAKPKAAPRKKAKITLDVICALLRGAGKITRAAFGALRFTRIRVYLPVSGEDPADTARAYGRVNAWLYTTLGVLDYFVYLDFEELRVVPQVDPAGPAARERVSFRVSARMLFVAIAAVEVLIELWREKVLDVFL